MKRIAALAVLFSAVLSAQTLLLFAAIDPCRLMDTREGGGFTGAFGPPSIPAGGTRTLPVPEQLACGIPATARAYVLNVTVVPHGPLGYITLWPTGRPQPNVSTLNALDGQITANAAIVRAGAGGGVDIYVYNDTDVIVDINGYFVEVGGVVPPEPPEPPTPPEPPAKLIEPRSISDWRQVEPLTGQRTGWTIPLASVKLDPKLLAEWRRRAIGPCVTYASVTFAPGTGPILVIGMGTVVTEDVPLRYESVRRFWFAK